MRLLRFISIFLFILTFDMSILNARCVQTNGLYSPVRVTALATAPNCQIYAGVENAGIYTSTNSGETQFEFCSSYKKMLLMK